MPMPEIIKPQPKQEEFLKNSADVVIYGGRCCWRRKIVEPTI